MTVGLLYADLAIQNGAIEIARNKPHGVEVCVSVLMCGNSEFLISTWRELISADTNIADSPKSDNREYGYTAPLSAKRVFQHKTGLHALKCW